MTIVATRRRHHLDLIVAYLFAPTAAAIKHPRPSPGLALNGDALAIALDERVRGDDVGIPQERSHPSSDGGGAIDGVVIGVRDADPTPSVHTEQSQAVAMPHRRRDGGRRVVVVLPTRRGPC